MDPVHMAAGHYPNGDGVDSKLGLGCQLLPLELWSYSPDSGSEAFDSSQPLALSRELPSPKGS